MTASRTAWFAELLRAGLDTKLLTETEILSHATPAVLISSLPRDVLATVFDSALSSGTMSPEELVRSATPETLAEHVPARVIWSCIAAAAEKAGIPGPKPPANDTAARDLVRRAIAGGLGNGTITAKDIVRHVDAKILAHSLPDALTQKLLEASLAAGKMNPEIVIEAVGVAGITAHVPVHVMWACVAAAADPLLGASGEVSMSRKPALEYVEDEVASVLVDLDDSSVLKPMMVDTKEAQPSKSQTTKNVVRRPSS